MDRKHFFDAVRETIFDGSLKQSQVDGMEALLDACAELQVADQRHVAYLLATPMIETGGSFVPIVENLNYSASALKSKFGGRISAADADRYGRTSQHPANQPEIANRIYGGDWGRAHLGNTAGTDGWTFRGRGLCQITGRANYAKFSVVSDPDRAATLPTAATIMVRGMRDGLFTGKNLRDYFTATSSDWINARRIINGIDRSNDIAGYAKLFNSALQDAA
jgi:putative chitinase